MNKKAFTIIELIVWITISMMLMVSVGIFVGNWMQSILQWQKVLENTSNFTDFSSDLHTKFNLVQSGSFLPVKTASWILFKVSQSFWEWGFSYIWTETLSWVYCKPDSEDPKTNNAILKTFIPFEEQWENISNNYAWILTASWWTSYTSYQKEHLIKDSLWDIVVWKWVFWNRFKEWNLWTDIYLNSPTWLALSWTTLFIADTLNNRVLYYDTISEKINKLLDESDWLNEPTWLYYEDNSLYIANSGNWEILKYSSKAETQWTLTLTWITQSNINKFEIYFLNQEGNNQNITWPTKSDITVPWTSDNFSEINSNILSYYFINYSWSNILINDCTWESWNEILSWWNPVKCTDSWTWQTSTPVSINFNNNKITINNINNLSNTWSYYVNLKLFNWTTEEYSEYFPYFTQSDNNILTPEDNILTIYKSDLNYPTWIWWTWSTDFNEFWDRLFPTLTLDYDSTDILLETPIKSINIDNSTSELITLLLKYYKSYNCYNLEQKIERTFILKKSLK